MRLITVFTLILLVAAFSIGCASSSDSDTTPVPTITLEQTTTPEPAVLVHDLEVTVEPKEAAIILLNPRPIGDRKYVQGRTVTIDVSPQPGWEVDEWLGPVFEVAGRSAKINMNVSHSVIVRLVRSSASLPIQTPISGRVAKLLPTVFTPQSVGKSPTTAAAPPTSTRTPARPPNEILITSPASTRSPTSIRKPTSIRVVTPVPKLHTPARGKVLFQDDFESGSAKNWGYLSSGLTIVRDKTGNYVLQTNGVQDRYPSASAGDVTWRDYALEFRVRITEILNVNSSWDFFAGIRSDLNRPVCTGYSVWFRADNDSAGIASSGAYEKGCNSNLASVFPVNLTTGQWYSIRIEAVGPMITVYFDDEVILRTEVSDEPFLTGSIQLFGGPGTTVQFDDVKVVEISTLRVGTPIWFGEVFTDRATRDTPRWDSYGGFQSRLESLGYVVETGLSVPTTEKLSTFSIIVLPKPNKFTFNEQFSDALLDLVADGMALLIILDAGLPNFVNALTEKLGVRVHGGEVTFDFGSQSPGVFEITNIAKAHPITKGIERLTASSMSPVVVTPPQVEASVEVLVYTPESVEGPTWGTGPFAHTIARIPP